MSRIRPEQSQSRRATECCLTEGMNSSLHRELFYSLCQVNSRLFPWRVMEVYAAYDENRFTVPGIGKMEYYRAASEVKKIPVYSIKSS